jgi:hypothetical protein
MAPHVSTPSKFCSLWGVVVLVNVVHVISHGSSWGKIPHKLMAKAALAMEWQLCRHCEGIYYTGHPGVALTRWDTDY